MSRLHIFDTDIVDLYVKSSVVKVFPLQYFPPIPWFAAAQDEHSIILEVCQHYRKQQYTNRMRIRASNRILPLIIPLSRTGAHTPIGKKQIAYQEDWPKQHWKSIESAYGAAPYFPYYAQELKTFFDQQPVGLLQLNFDALEWALRRLQLDIRLDLTHTYLPSEAYEADFRQAFDPSGQMLPPWFQAIPYPQVFEGFEAGLSILDLILNEGPNARLLLRQMRKDK